MGRMPLLQNIFLAFLFIVWIKQCRKTMHQMGRNTRLLDWWINHSICSLLKVSRVTLVNLISLITGTSLFIHFLPFVFSFLSYQVFSSKYNLLNHCFVCLFIFLSVVFRVYNLWVILLLYWVMSFIWREIEVLAYMATSLINMKVELVPDVPKCETWWYVNLYGFVFGKMKVLEFGMTLVANMTF